MANAEAKAIGGQALEGSSWPENTLERVRGAASSRAAKLNTPNLVAPISSRNAALPAKIFSNQGCSSCIHHRL